MAEEKRELIVRIQRGETHKGAKPVIEMWNENPRLEFPELRLFELHKLFEVGIDPNQLAEGEELITRFWVYYEDSDRLNKNSNPYKDVTRLEAIAPPKSTAQQTLDAMLAALRQIDQRLAVACSLLETLVEGEELAVQVAGVTLEVLPEIQRPAPASPRPAPPQAEAPVLNEDQARRRFGKLAGPAIRAGTVHAELPGRLTAEVTAGAKNWRDALQALEDAIEGAKSA